MILTTVGLGHPRSRPPWRKHGWRKINIQLRTKDRHAHDRTPQITLCNTSKFAFGGFIFKSAHQPESPFRPFSIWVALPLAPLIFHAQQAQHAAPHAGPRTHHTTAVRSTHHERAGAAASRAATGGRRHAGGGRRWRREFEDAIPSPDGAPTLVVRPPPDDGKHGSRAHTHRQAPATPVGLDRRQPCREASRGSWGLEEHEEVVHQEKDAERWDDCRPEATSEKIMASARGL